ncbi:nickel pincer cofactor biosynthesis protein LarC [Dendrosporobacter sp. 1207_IL3150]|uniref:nickel pincer cofactor biosynthesis protein LarC n=1 Tax=Dendrosporobacter sp. 1207_IL3150 TaxID=3084054 RepID=UPI002FD88397
MKVLYLDCFSGISGNMFLGALIDAGMPEQYLREQLGKLPVTGYRLDIERTKKCGISAIYADVKLHTHQHHHHDHEHHHRHLPDIVEIIEKADLNSVVKTNSIKIFMELAKAEAKVHGTTIEKIHFHEVGAVDAIVDIVGAAIGLDWLGIERIYTSKLHVGSGFIKCDHGVMPVPAPATSELLKNIPYYSGDITKELVTPTGAAIIAALGTEYGAMPANFISKIVAYGAGTWDLEIPNVLRMHVGELDVASANNVHPLKVIEANIDDLNPQVYEYVMEKLLKAGALDVWLTPIIMKKSRPATKLSVLIENTELDKMVDIIFKETSTIGMRFYSVERSVAERKLTTVNTDWGLVKVKVSYQDGKIINITPEYDVCKQLAEANNVPLKAIQQEALAQAWKQLV